VICASFALASGISSCTGPLANPSDPPSLACMGCNDGVQFLNFWIQSPLLKSSLVNALSTECNKLPQQEALACVNTVTDGWALIIKSIFDFTVEICPSSALCCAVQPAVPASLSFVKDVAQMKAKSAGMCGLLDELTAIMPKIVTKMVSICDEMTGEAQVMCLKTFADSNATLIDMGDSFLRTIFNSIPFVNCPPSPALNVIAPIVTAFDPKCTACWDGINMINFLIKSPFIEGALKGLFQEACNELEQPLVAPCSNTLNSAFTMIIEDIQGFVGLTCPDALGPSCAKPPSRADVVTNTLLKRMLPTSKAAEGFMCEMFQPLYNSIPKTYTYFLKVCAQLPATSEAACTKFFKTQPEKVIEMLQFVVTGIVEKLFHTKCEFATSK
jgi:hypothetical protein